MTNEIKKLKEDIDILQQKLEALEKLEELKEPKSPVEELYKEWWGQYPELETDSKYDDMRWQGFQAGYEAAEKSKVEPSLINCVLEGNPPNGYSYWNEWFRELGSKGILHNLKISSKELNEKVKEPTKPMDEVVERLLKKYQEQKLYNRLFEFNYDKEDCDWILGIVEDWIPDEQSSEGSQNVNNELLVEGFNDAIRKMKEMLR